jgi:hypothetical protein
MSRWSTAAVYARMLWWLSIWASAIFSIIAGLSHDAQFLGVDFTGYFFFYAIVCLIYLLCAEIVPQFWWLVTFPWRLRSRPLAAVGVVAAVALWLSPLLAVLPHYYGPAIQLVCANMSVIAIVALYRLARYRRKQAFAAESKS